MGKPDIALYAGPAGSNPAVQKLLQDKSLQFQFPQGLPAPVMPGWLVRLLAFISQHVVWFRAAGWAVLALVVLALGYGVWRACRNSASRADPVAAAAPSLWQPSAQQARLMLRDADALAQQGRFAEAAHHLLLVSIQEIADRRPGTVAPAFTSREISRLERLTPQARSIFSQIAQVVEHAIFGARPLGAGEFAACRSAFEQFITAANWQAA